MQKGLRLDQEIPVRLTDDDLLERGQNLAEHVARRTRLVDAKKAETKRRQDEIDLVDAEIARLGRVISEAHENRKQGDLFADQDKQAAQEALAKVAAMQVCSEMGAKDCPVHGECTCQEENVAAVDCPLHGAESKHARGENAPAPLPTDPHTFENTGGGEVMCTFCGSTEEDPVHHHGGGKPEPHAFEMGSIEDGKANICAIASCGLPIEHDVHTLCTITPETEIPEEAGADASGDEAEDGGGVENPEDSSGDELGGEA